MLMHVPWPPGAPAPPRVDALLPPGGAAHLHLGVPPLAHQAPGGEEVNRWVLLRVKMSITVGAKWN